tara:strand:- start:76 stop:462 length:387 start_codon:yes stop_codon:yes gene_type:complete
MKKLKLIEMLSNVKGNPEIKLWNGFVHDWVDILPELVQVNLKRMTQEYWLESCRLQDCRDLDDYTHQLAQEEVHMLKASYSSGCKWEENPFVTQNDIEMKRYSTRTVLVMQAKNKGVRTFDRAGNISY